MRDNRLVIEFEGKDAEMVSEWKRLCLGLYGNGGIKKRGVEIIKEDLRKLKK